MDRKHEALEVVMTWGGTPQHAELLGEPRPVTVGDSSDDTFVMPREVIGEPFALVEPTDEGYVLCIPAGAEARMIADADGARTPIDLATLPIDARGTRRAVLRDGTIADVTLGAFTFHVRTTDAKVERPGPVAIDWAPYRWIGASLLFHAVLIAIFLMQPPDAGALSVDLDRQNLSRMQYYMAAIEQDRVIDDSHLAGEAGAATSEGRPMEGDEGAAGAEDETRNTGGQVRVRGQDTEPRVPLTANDVRQLSTFGMLAAAAASLSEISSPYGVENAQGWSEMDAYGPLMADAAGFGPGRGGFGMTNAGRGGCPAGATNCLQGVVGSGNFDTVGTTGGCSREDFEGFVRRYGRAGAMDRCSGTSRTVGDSTLQREGNGTPIVRLVGDAEPVGGLSREQVRRTVRRNIPQVRHCYEQALINRPDLEGRVSVAFVIGQSGAVMSAQIAQNDLADASVAPCIAEAVRRWGFPSSPGVTSVTYPFQLTTP